MLSNSATPRHALQAIQQEIQSQHKEKNCQAPTSAVDIPVLANGRLELRYYLREQALSQTVHRYGNVMNTYRQT
jgi:RHH-type proline utilization regulon transcriptional repressor/proline dehydrogenase/delta 1-pyrroline-5-carboxylate dehydrogenase